MFATAGLNDDPEYDLLWGEGADVVELSRSRWICLQSGLRGINQLSTPTSAQQSSPSQSKTEEPKKYHPPSPNHSQTSTPNRLPSPLQPVTYDLVGRSLQSSSRPNRIP